jgi:pimeloyl-ACP methyl ester carboxylesterase
LAAWPFLSLLKRGDGHPIIVFPGLVAGDATTLPLRSFLSNLGYQVEGWNQGVNLGPRDGVIEHAREQVKTYFKRTGRKVSLIGWSLGGIYARELAKLEPKCVRCVITMGSPFAGPPQATNAFKIYQLASGLSVDPTLQASLSEAPPVPTTSIYSRTDGVVAWECSIEKDSPISESVEIHASHVGMGANPIAWFVLADRLQQIDGQWRPFERIGISRLFIPDKKSS